MKIYEPRNSFVLIQIEVVDATAGGVAVPSTSAQGRKFRVVAVGNFVEDLGVGDYVVICAKPDEGMGYPIPNQSDLFLVEEQYIAAIVGE